MKKKSYTCVLWNMRWSGFSDHVSMHVKLGYEALDISSPPGDKRGDREAGGGSMWARNVLPGFGVHLW